MAQILGITMKESGGILSVDRDFQIYSGSNNNVTLHIHVPKSILMEHVYRYETRTGSIVSITGVGIDREGRETRTRTHTLRYIGRSTRDLVEYYTFERKLPNAYTYYPGNYDINIKVKNILADENGLRHEQTVASALYQLTVLQGTMGAIFPSDDPAQIVELEARVTGVEMRMDDLQHDNEMTRDIAERAETIATMADEKADEALAAVEAMQPVSIPITVGMWGTTKTITIDPADYGISPTKQIFTELHKYKQDGSAIKIPDKINFADGKIILTTNNPYNGVLLINGTLSAPPEIEIIGMEQVFVDSTLVGNGTPQNPLGASGELARKAELQAESNRLDGLVVGLQSELAQEAQARAAADADLQQQIDALETGSGYVTQGMLDSAVNNLQDQIDNIELDAPNITFESQLPAPTNPGDPVPLTSTNVESALDELTERNQAVENARAQTESDLQDLNDELQTTNENLAGAATYDLTGAYLTLIPKGITPVAKNLFDPTAAPMVVGKSLIHDANGTLGVYIGDADPATANILTMSNSDMGGTANVSLGEVATYANLPTNVSSPWFIQTPVVGNYVRIIADENAGGATTERSIIAIDTSGNITWGNPTVIAGGNYQTQTTTGMAGRVLTGGATAGTFGTALEVDTTATENSTNLINSDAVFKAVDAEQQRAEGVEATKADKVTSATAGNFAGLDANGNLTDSGFNESDFAPESHTTDPNAHSSLFDAKLDAADGVAYDSERLGGEVAMNYAKLAGANFTSLQVSGNNVATQRWVQESNYKTSSAGLTIVNQSLLESIIALNLLIGQTSYHRSFVGVDQPITDMPADVTSASFSLSVTRLLATHINVSLQTSSGAEYSRTIINANTTPAWSGGWIKSVNPNYSTTETLTGGTWIDGKPIYRRVYTGTTPTTEGTQISLGTVPSGTDTIVHIQQSIVRTTGHKITSGYVNIQGELAPSSLVNVNRNVNVVAPPNTMADALDCPISVIVEYTKV